MMEREVQYALPFPLTVNDKKRYLNPQLGKTKRLFHYII